MKGITEMAEILHLTHSFGPLYDPESRVLILGSFPSVKSREAGFFYGHPQNRFWKVIAALTKRELPSSIPEKKALLHESHIALWDTIASCEITGASDSSITNVTPNDLSPILETAKIRAVFCNGAASHKLYMKYIFPVTGREAVKLPSTSPANAACSLEKLISSWSILKDSLV